MRKILRNLTFVSHKNDHNHEENAWKWTIYVKENLKNERRTLKFNGIVFVMLKIRNETIICKKKLTTDEDISSSIDYSHPFFLDSNWTMKKGKDWERDKVKRSEEGNVQWSLPLSRQLLWEGRGGDSDPRRAR